MENLYLHPVFATETFNLDVSLALFALYKTASLISRTRSSNCVKSRMKQVTSLNSNLMSSNYNKRLPNHAYNQRAPRVVLWHKMLHYYKKSINCDVNCTKLWFRQTQAAISTTHLSKNTNKMQLKYNNCVTKSRRDSGRHRPPASCQNCSENIVLLNSICQDEQSHSSYDLTIRRSKTHIFTIALLIWENMTPNNSAKLIVFFGFFALYIYIPKNGVKIISTKNLL